jgi:coenzyme F420-0:L-glutamate ligase
VPPKDDLLAKIIESKLRLKDGDILAISSKVVSISEGRCIPCASIEKKDLIKRESQLFYAPHHTARWGYFFTIAQGVLVGSAGVDQSNGNGHFVLWPKDPMRSAVRLRAALMKHYKIKKLGVLITDSTSKPLRRGAMGFALSWAGIDPLHDYRGTKDIFGHAIRVEQANLVDGLAAAAVLVMGEGSERTPVALIRGVPARVWKGRHTNRGWNKFIVPLKDDLFAPFLTKVKWQKGGGDRN